MVTVIPYLLEYSLPVLMSMLMHSDFDRWQL